MGDIYIPEHAIKNEQVFKAYVMSLYGHLFKGKALVECKDELPESLEDQVVLAERIMEVVNYYMHGKFEVPAYKRKNRKGNMAITDVTAVTSIILEHHYAVRIVQLGKILRVHHATIIYYRKKFDALCVTKKFKYDYVRMVLQLHKHGLLHYVSLHTKEFREIRRLIEEKKVVL